MCGMSLEISRNSSSLRPALDREILDITNDFRAEQSLPPLRWHKGLADVAKRHATQVAEGIAPFSHSGAPNRFAHCGTKCINVAENLARADGFSREDIPSVVVDNWRASEGHKRNLLGPFDSCGIGFAASDSGVIFVTQLLALVAEQPDWKGVVTSVKETISSTPVVCAAVGLTLGGGPATALAAGAVGGALERKYGVHLASSPRVLVNRVNTWFRPAECASCGQTGKNDDLFASSSRSGTSSEDVQLLCRQCHPSPDSSDIWCYVE